jgi:hypothetical protein
MRIPTRLAALLAGGALVMSCDTRSGGVGPIAIDNGDVTPPTISFALSAGANKVIDVGTALNVTVTATDNVGVAVLNTTIKNGATAIGADTVTVKPAATSEVRVVPVPTAGLQRGDQLVIRATAADGAGNLTTDSIMVTVADTTAPTMTIFSSKSGRTLKGGDSLDVRVTAADSAGIVKTGYRVYHTGGADSLTVVIGDSVSAAAGATITSMTGTFNRLLPAALAIGTYRVVGFALDRSGLAPNPGPSVSFTVVDGVPPTVTFIAPKPGATVNVGDSILVRVNLHDNVALKNVTFYAVSPRGDASLGTADTVMRYSAVTAPQGTNTAFRAGLTDTLDLRRYLKPLTPLDTVPGKLIVYGVVTDMAGNVTKDTVVVQMTKGPNVSLNAPLGTDSLTRGTKLRIIVSAASGVGVSKLGFDVVSGASGPAWPTPVAKTYDTTFAAPPLKTGPYAVDIDIPADAPSLGMLTISPHATDVNGQPGAPSPQDFFVRVGAAPPPFVRQQIASRVELRDSVTIYASGASLTQVGYVMRDLLTGVRVDSNSVPASSSSFGPQGIFFNLPTTLQGKRISISAFARDSAGKIGWAVPAGGTVPVTDTSRMARDTALVVYGRTYALPASRSNLIADVLVDTIHGNVFLSNIEAGRVEVFQQSTQTFDPTGIAVASQPWGMTMSRTASAHDTLYVANSGATSLSRVYVGAATPSGMKEDVANRMLTRISLLYKVTETRDPSTGKIRLALTGPILFSDRPQYVEQSSSGMLYLSTKPTPASGMKGTVRYMNPGKGVAAQAPDQRFILAFATRGTDPNSYLIANIDNAVVAPASANSTASDTLTLCDHASGTTAPTQCVSSADGVGATVVKLRTQVPTTDIDAQANLDEGSLGLTDTTYAATSGNGQWITFGEGHRAPYARAFLLKDDGSVPDKYSYASPSLNILDLINNASDQVFGVALDRTGQTLAIHGSETYFASVTEPFTQRLQGKKTTFSVGSGIAFHPDADGTSTPAASRLAFVASSNGTVEMVDVAYYDFSRGTLATKANLYGPLRAATPTAAEQAAGIRVKLYGMSAAGLVIIDVTDADILPGP